jgi:predicted nuclease of predicted toxin-antitoxin system
VVHVKDIDMRTASDSSILDAAVNSGRIILTSDFSDYKALDAAFRSVGREYPGIILLPEKPVGEVVRSLEAFDFEQIYSTIRFL